MKRLGFAFRKVSKDSNLFQHSITFYRSRCLFSVENFSIRNNSKESNHYPYAWTNQTQPNCLCACRMQIMWPNSGWHPIPLTNLKESSHVKKAYQKARLCLHPDKLQQRGATLQHKYVAEKAFPILQVNFCFFHLKFNHSCHFVATLY